MDVLGPVGWSWLEHYRRHRPRLLALEESWVGVLSDIGLDGLFWCAECCGPVAEFPSTWRLMFGPGEFTREHHEAVAEVCRFDILRACKLAGVDPPSGLWP